MKKIWSYILATLAIIGTYIGVNQFTNRSGDSKSIEKEEFTPPKRPKPKTTQPGGSRLK